MGRIPDFNPIESHETTPWTAYHWFLLDQLPKTCSWSFDVAHGFIKKDIMFSGLLSDSPMRTLVGLAIRSCGLVFIVFNVLNIFNLVLFLAIVIASLVLLSILHACTNIGTGANRPSKTKTAVIFCKAIADFGLILAIVYYLIIYSAEGGYDWIKIVQENVRENVNIVVWNDILVS